MLCEHKDCERTDATPLEFRHYDQDGEFLDASRWHFCPEHKRQLFALEETKTLPPAEWFGEAEQAVQEPSD